MSLSNPSIPGDAISVRKSWKGRLWRAFLLFLVACFAFLVFGVALLVTMPASALQVLIPVPAQVTGIYGGVWNGRAMLSDGYSVEWRLRARSLFLVRGVVDWNLKGRDTQLIGIATATPWSVTGNDIVGRAGPGLLALMPDSALSDCTPGAVLDVQEVAWREGRFSASGVISTDEGTCKDLLGRTIGLPSMTLDLSTQGADARGDLRDRDGRLAQVTVTGDRRLILRVEPEGAALVPGLPTGGPMVIEYPF